MDRMTKAIEKAYQGQYLSRQTSSAKASELMLCSSKILKGT